MSPIGRAEVDRAEAHPADVRHALAQGTRAAGQALARRPDDRRRDPLSTVEAEVRQ